MKFLVLFYLSLTVGFLQAQDSGRLHYIDSLVKVCIQKAAAEKYELVERGLLLEGNKTKPLRFLKEGDEVSCIIVQDSTRENLEIYYLKNNELIFTLGSKIGDWKNPDYSVYFLGNTAYLKRNESLKLVNGVIWTAKISSYMDILIISDKIN